MMNLRPRASLGRVLDDLGTTLLELVYGDAERTEEIRGVVIYDRDDKPELPPSALVLGVGVTDPDEIAAVLHELGELGAAALVLRAPVQRSDALATAAKRSGVAVLGLTRGASWAQLAALLRSVLAEGEVGSGGSESLAGAPSGDLFALANALAALLDAPVTIEDRSSRVIAFSGGQDHADAPRVETILERQIPERMSRILVERGVFRDLYRSDKPVWVDPIDPARGDIPRVALAVRAGDEVLGSIWVAVRTPLTEERVDALCDAAKVVALHLLHIRAGADVQHRLKADLLSTALEGRIGAHEALARLNLADQPVVVVGFTTTESTDAGLADAGLADAEASGTAHRQRLSDAFAMHLSAVHPRSAAALIGNVTYGLIPLHARRTDGEDRAMQVAEDFLQRSGRAASVLVAVGPVARNVAELSSGRVDVDRVLRVLRSRSSGGRVARLSDVYVEALMLELRDLLRSRGDPPTGALARLVAYDAQHKTQMVETLRAWLDSFGDIKVAAAAVNVHPNTLRYRLSRLAEIGGIDLDDREERFAAMLQLRVVSDLGGQTG